MNADISTTERLKEEKISLLIKAKDLEYKSYYLYDDAEDLMLKSRGKLLEARRLQRKIDSIYDRLQREYGFKGLFFEEDTRKELEKRLSTQTPITPFRP